MTKQLTFIHAADLHLGAPFRGLRGLSDAWADRLLDALAQSYDHVIEAAIARKVDFVVIAGDIFDGARPSYKDYLHFFGGLRRLEKAQIPAYLVTGNHDPYTSWSDDFLSLPSNVVMLPGDKPDFHLFEKEGDPLCIVGGRGYYNQTWPAGECMAEGVTRSLAKKAILEQNPAVCDVPFVVGVLHAGLDLDMLKAPVSPKKLMGAEMDYWALGHIHKKYAYPSLENPKIVFSGCAQGRDIKETGERGVYHVTLTEGAPNKIEFIPTASVVWQRITVSVSECMSLPEITEKVMSKLFYKNGYAHCEEMVARVTLTGASSLHSVLGNPGVLEDLRQHINKVYPSFFCDALVDETVEPRDKEALRREALFPAVLLDVSEEYKGKREEAISYLQAELLEKNINMSSECLRAIERLSYEAEDLVLDLLSQGESR